MITRRSFLLLGGAGLITTATMAEAGALAEVMDWMKRKPVFSIPPYRPNDDGPEMFRVMKVRDGVPTHFELIGMPDNFYPEAEGGFFGVDGRIAWLTGANAHTSSEITRKPEHRWHKRPIPGWCRVGDLLDYHDLRTMPPPPTAEAMNGAVRSAILSAYNAEASGDPERIAASSRLSWG